MGPQAYIGSIVAARIRSGGFDVSRCDSRHLALLFRDRIDAGRPVETQAPGCTDDPCVPAKRQVGIVLYFFTFRRSVSLIAGPHPRFLIGNTHAVRDAVCK